MFVYEWQTRGGKCAAHGQRSRATEPSKHSPTGRICHPSRFATVSALPPTYHALPPWEQREGKGTNQAAVYVSRTQVCEPSGGLSVAALQTPAYRSDQLSTGSASQLDAVTKQSHDHPGPRPSCPQSVRQRRCSSVGVFPSLDGMLTPKCRR